MAELKSFNNRAFLNKINPLKVILLAFLVWFFLFLTAPLSINISLNTDAYILLFFNIIAFSLGTFLYKNHSEYSIVPKSHKHLVKLFNIIFFLSILGLLAKLGDRFLVRGISLNADYFANRESMEGEGGNILAIIGALLTPLAIVPLFLMWKYKLKFTKLFKALVFILFFVQVFDALLLGSRSILFVLFILFGLYLIYFKKIRLTFWKTSCSILTILSFMLIMNFIFIERTKEFAGDNVYELLLNKSNFNFTITSSQSFKNDFHEMNSISQTLAFTYISTVQYFVHGMFEFSFLYDNFQKEHSLGGYTFAIYDRFISKITGDNFSLREVQKLAPREAVYTTFYGPLYIDFGWFSIIFMFLFGKFARNINEKAKKGSDWAILLYFYLFVVLMFSPVFNFVNGAGGLFLFSSILLFGFLSTNFYKKYRKS